MEEIVNRKLLSILAVAMFLMSMAVFAIQVNAWTYPPGKVLTGGAFWAGSTNVIAFSWVATHPIVYGNDYEGGYGTYEVGNTYGPNIRDFSVVGASEIILKGDVYLENIGVWPYTSYFEIGIGGSINGYH
jgi:hypothetical protein